MVGADGVLGAGDCGGGMEDGELMKGLMYGVSVTQRCFWFSQYLWLNQWYELHSVVHGDGGVYEPLVKDGAD